MENTLYIPENDCLPEQGYFSTNQLCEMLRKYKNQPDKIQFLADLLEE